MAITVEDKTYRNLPEQVEENANNIEWLKQTISEFGNVMRYCGSVATYADLPADDNRVGDVYNVLDTGNNYAWDGEAWDEISSIVDLSGYVQKACIALEYDEHSTYSASSIVFHEDKLYANPSAITTPEVWTAAHWVEIMVSNFFVKTAGDQVIGGLKIFFTIEAREIYGGGTNQRLFLANNDNVDNFVQIDYDSTYFAQSILPFADDLKSLGNITNRWKDLSLSGVINPNSSGYGLSLPSTASLAANSEIVDTVSAQTISGEKTFTASPIIQNANNSSITLKFSAGNDGNAYLILSGVARYKFGSNVISPQVNNSYDLGGSGTLWKDIYLGGKIYFGTGDIHYTSNNFYLNLNGNDKYLFSSSSFQPNGSSNNGVIDLGASNRRFKDLYLSGVISDGTNSVSIADLKALIDYAKAQGWIS